MKSGVRYLSVAEPDTAATFDFLSVGVVVELRLVDGKLEVEARMSHGEDTSSWDLHEVSWPLPGRDS